MDEVNQRRLGVEKRIERLLEFLTSQGHAVSLTALKEGIARYEGASDWAAFEAKLRSAFLLPAEQKALEDVFSEWDKSLSFELIRQQLRNSFQVPAGFVPKLQYRLSSGVGLAAALEKQYDRHEADLPMVEFRALETCLVSWGGLSYEEVLEILDTDNEVMMEHMEVGDSQSELTPAELAAKIRSEYRHFRRHSYNS